jgi:hypothetical protein
MKKISVTLFILVAIATFAGAQTVRETRLSVLDSDRMGFSIEFNFEQKVLQDAWNKKCEELKIKSKPSKGLDVFTAVLVPDIHFESIDMYVKIDKLDKTRSEIAITFSKGNTNFITNEDGKMVENMNRFLDKFILYADQYKLGLDIADQEDQIKNTQKAYDKLIDEGKKLQEQMDKNKVDQENKVKELEALNKGLEALKLKVKK